MNTCICPAHVRILNVGWLAHKKRDAAHDAAAALTRGPMSWPAGTWQPGRDMSDDGHGAMPRRGGGWRTELSHDGWGRNLRNRGFDAEQRPRGWHGEESRGAAAGTLRHGESSFGEEQTWYDDLALGADFADAQHQPSFNVAAEDGDSPSPRQAARVKQLLEQAEAEAEAHGRSAVLGADGGDTGSPQHARRRAGPRVSRTASTGSWSDSDGSWHASRRSSDGGWSDSSGGSWPDSAHSEYPPVQFEEGVVRGSMEGVLDRLLGAGGSSSGHGLRGAHTQQRWKSEMFVMLPESSVLKCGDQLASQPSTR